MPSPLLSLGILPSLLTAIDRSLFDALLYASFLLQIVPVGIEVVSAYDGDYCPKNDLKAVNNDEDGGFKQTSCKRHT